MKKIIKTDKAPAAIGPYSQGIIAGNMIFTAGQIPLNPKTGEMITSNIQDETKQSLDNVKAVLEEAGSTLNNAVKLTVYITNMGEFAQINEIYQQYFTDPNNYPAREVIQVSALPKGCNVEIAAIALKD